MRDGEFTEAVKKQIAQEAMFICSSPSCFRFTAYNTSEGHARTIAEAAHVNAASKKGPRAKPNADLKKLKSKENGIWLCRICHKLIDDAPKCYPEPLLRQWKKDHREILRKIVGKDLESAILDLRNHKRHHDEAREFLSFLENKRVMYEGMDHEFPPRVLQSLELIRERLVQTRAKVNPDKELFMALNQLQGAIDTFLREVGSDTDLNNLRCDSNDPKWLKFSEELGKLRKGIVIIVKVLAGDSGYTLSWV
jgi:hypothetical protein